MATIIFDLDGTLIDTAPDLIDTLNLTLGREGLPPVAYEEARRLVGFGARRMIERGLALAGTAKSAAELDRVFADFIAIMPTILPIARGSFRASSRRSMR
jgi:phosphoglycolate phosphatase